MSQESELAIPLDVPENMRETFRNNYNLMTQGTGKLMLFAGDQKVEHMNDDFYGENISSDDNVPNHLFNIASKAKIGVFATQLGLIARYGMDYKNVNYLVKLNSKTNLIKTSQMDPLSGQWFEVEQVAEFRKMSGLSITSVGYTLYLGSEFENEMINQAAQIVFQAHQNGLLAVLWMYPRGAAVKDERDPHLIAGATGVAACLGADYAKVNPPKQKETGEKDILKEAILAAGRTKVICAGGSHMDVRSFLDQLHDQIHVSGASGNATGRNIHQRPFDEAVGFANAVYGITVENMTVDEAMKSAGIE